MFSSCSTLDSSESMAVVPASMDMALTLISTPATWVIPTLAFPTFRFLSPMSMPFRPWIAMSVAVGSTNSQNATPYK